MGCTSSVPNMADVQSNTAGDEDDSKNFETRKQRDENEIQRNTPDKQTNNVLPTCDNLDENIELDRNNYSINFSDQQVDADKDDTKEKAESPLPGIAQQIVDEIPNLKDVVEQVILDNKLQSSSIDNISTLPENETNTKEKDDEIMEETIDPEVEASNNEDSSEPKEENENLEEFVSPSQSECSRATRWEALADIAAELPASLAVDPLTGQIYSLTK